MDIGIDFGSTSSVIAVRGKVELVPGYGEAKYLKEIDVSILPSPTGNMTIPSVMWWHPGEPDTYIFGDEAKQKVEEGKIPIMLSKRKIGTNEELICNGRTFTAWGVAERFFHFLKVWAEEVTGMQVKRAVVTHPVYFTLYQREEILLAAQDAGLDVTPAQLLMEPCAAALAYSLNDNRDPLRLMTYDLGGANFDVAITEKIEGVIVIRKFHGDRLLGGCDFDNALAQWILDELKAMGNAIPYDENNEEHRVIRARLLQVAETIKLRLAEQRTDMIPVPVQLDFLKDAQGNQVQFRGRINRLQFAALIQDMLDKTIQCCRSALEGAGIQAEDLHEILLVGGSAGGKWIVDTLVQEFGSVVAEPYHPEYCVAAGAAIFASELPPAATMNERIALALDYTSRSVLLNVNIAGRVFPSPGSDLTSETCRQLQVTLEAPNGEVLGPIEIGDTGKFIFRRVPLLEDGSISTFKVTVLENDNVLHYQEGSIAYVDIEEGKSKLQRYQLAEIQDRINSMVLGQEHAVRRIMPWISRMHSGLFRDDRPAAVFLFLGSAGTGKTQLCKELARYVYGNEEEMLYLEMGQFVSKESVNVFIGAPPGHIGYGEGKLTNGLRDHPECFILFDDIEMAHPEVFRIMMRFAREGRILGPGGPVRDGRKCIVVMTTNAGGHWLNEYVKDHPESLETPDFLADQLIEAAMEELASRNLHPELLECLDERIVFLPLSMETCRKIVDKILTQELPKFEEKGVIVTAPDDVRGILAKLTFEKAMDQGARGASRVVNSHVISPLIDLLAPIHERGERLPSRVIGVALGVYSRTADGKCGITWEIEA